MYSFGIILNVMWRRDEPYVERDFTGPLHLLRAVQEGLRPVVPDTTPRFLGELMNNCWAPEPGDRISAADAFAAFNEEEALQRAPWF